MTTQTMKYFIIIVCMIILWFGIQGIKTGRVREEGNEFPYTDEEEGFFQY